MAYRVELHYWNNQNGYTHSETIDNIDVCCTAEEYAKSLDNDLTPKNPNEAINIEIFDINDELLSEFWCQKN